MPLSRAGDAAQDRRGPAAARIAGKHKVLAVQHHPLDVPLAHVVVDRHSAIRREHAQFLSLVQAIIDRLGHGCVVSCQIRLKGTYLLLD